MKGKTLMRKPNSRRALRAAAGLGAAIASLAFAGAASAAVQVISPDQPINGSCPASPPATDTLTAAIQNATAATNTIVLEPGVYCPVIPSGQTTITISHNLNIVGDHSYQATQYPFDLDVVGTDEPPTDAALFTIPSGVSVRMDGFDTSAIGVNSTYGGINNSGTLTTWGMTFEGSAATAIVASAGSTTNLNETSLTDDGNDGISSSGVVNLQNVTIANGNGSALDILPGSSFHANNTLIAHNGSPECSIGHISGGTASLDDDGTCNVQYSDNTDVDNYLGFTATYPDGVDADNGGPVTTTTLAPNPDTTLKGVNCPTVDNRFYVNPVSGGVIQCDIGATTGSLDPTAYSNGQWVPVSGSATQETAAPTCKVTGGTTGVSQTVLLNDTASGIGPEPGLQTDNTSNTVATAYPPPVASPVPGYAVTNLQISNGSVSFSSPTAPTTSGVVLTAGNKTTTGVNNSQWSFTGLNWAGVAKNCF